MDEPVFPDPQTPLGGYFDSPSSLSGRRAGTITLYEDVQYAFRPGYRPLLIDIRVPDADGPTPLVLMLHGGAWMLGTIKRRRGGDEIDGRLADALLARGISVATPQYRLSAEVRFPGQLDDVLDAVRWLDLAAARLGIDPSRIGTWGQSAGGHLALLAATNAALDVPELADYGVIPPIVASVGWYPPTALDLMDEQSAPDAILKHNDPDSPESRLLGITIAADPKAARAASPTHYVSDAHAPTLLVHGEADRVVPVRQSMIYHEHLGAVGVASQLVMVPGADHVFVGVDAQPLVEMTAEWLADHL